MKNLAEAIEKLLSEYRACWSQLDFQGLRGLWDEATTRPVYLAEESDVFMFDWDRIEAYWAATRSATRRIELETWGLNAQPIGDGLATAAFRMRWRGEFAGYAGPIGGDTRVSAILRLCPAGWRFIQYVEAPLAPIAYFKRFYERFAVAPPPREP